MRSTISYVVALTLMAATAALMLAFVMPVQADGIVDNLYVGGNGVWLDGPGRGFPADVEAHAGAAASLSPHLSLVGSVDYGFSHSYFRYQGGARVTATDVTNPDFNTFLGLVYRGGSTADVKPLEWAPDAGFGWRFMKDRWPNLLATGEASYGLTSSRVVAALGLRWELHLKGL